MNSASSPDVPADLVGNQLLAALPAEVLQHLLPDLEPFPLVLKSVLHQTGEPIDYVYFPGGGFVSELTGLETGDMVEVATVLMMRYMHAHVGLIMQSTACNPIHIVEQRLARWLLMAHDRVRADTFPLTQEFVAMPVASFQREMDRRGAFFDAVSKYRAALIRFMMQSTACNAVHTVEERLARWLLTAQDHLRTNVFPLTQEFVAMMLGVTRPTVSEIAGTLQRAGLITYHRGFVTIVDRERLQMAACECYGITAAIVDRLRVDAARGQRFRREATS